MDTALLEPTYYCQEPTRSCSSADARSCWDKLSPASTVLNHAHWMGLDPAVENYPVCLTLLRRASASQGTLTVNERNTSMGVSY